MMPHLNASAQTVIDTKKELLAEIENALSSGKTKISFVTSDLDQTDFDTLNQNIEGFYGVVMDDVIGGEVESLQVDKGISDKECKVFE